MTVHPQARTRTRVVLWFIAAMLPVAALTASAVTWRWEFALIYVVAAFGLQLMVRLKNTGARRFIHILVLSGSAPIVVRSYFGDVGAVALANIVAVLVVAIGVGCLLADRVRPEARTQSDVA